MSRAWRLLPLLCATLLAACVSTTPQGDSERVADPKEAARANVQLGVAYMQQGNLALAKEKLERAEKQDPKSHEVQWALASLSERLNQPKDAARHYEAAVRLAPNNPEVSNTYAVFLCRNGEVDKALPLFDRVIQDRLYRTPWAVSTNAAVCLRSDKRGGDAVAYLEKALAMRPDFIDAVVELADLKIEQGKGAEARAAVDRFLLIGRKSASVLVVGVRAALAEGNRNAADNYVRLLRRDFPNAPENRVVQQLLTPPSRPATP